MTSRLVTVVRGRLAAVRPEGMRERCGACLDGPMLALAAALGCILVNAFFVAAEFALAKVRPTSLEALASGGDGSAARAYAISQKLDAYLSATQLGITLASLALGWIGEPAMVELLSPLLRAVGAGERTAHRASIAIGFATISGLHIILGELVPKSLAIARPEDVARRTSLFLRAFFVVTFPALWLLNGASRLTLRALGLPSSENAEGRLSLEELRIVIDHGVEDVDATRRSILERVLRATDRPIRTIMVPRVDMQILSLSDSPDVWMEKVRRHGFSRYPVSDDGQADHVTGYVYVKDLIMGSERRKPRSIAALRRDILVVPERARISDVLAEFQRTTIPIALVVDEHGGTAGLVTLEDVVTELVGDLKDELGRTKAGVSVEGGGDLVADGRTPAAELDLDGQPVPDARDKSVGAWIVEKLGHLAAPGDAVELEGWDAIVEDVRARRVHRVRFHRRSDPPPALGTA